MAKKTKSVHADKYAADAANANRALIQLNKRWDNRVVVDTMLPQQQSTATSSQLEEPLAQWELDQLNQPLTSQSSDERPVIDWRPKYDDDFDYFDSEEPNYCKVCWRESGERHDDSHTFAVASREEYAQHKRDASAQDSFYAEESAQRRFEEQKSIGNVDFAYGA